MLTQSVAYAIRALAYLADMGEHPVLVKEISEAMDIPQAFLAKIIHTLGRKHLVTTRRGIGGGIALARKPASICLYEICVALDEPLLENRCFLGLPRCSEANPCPLHLFWSHQREVELEFLRKTTLADVAQMMVKQRSRTVKNLTGLQRG